MSNKEYFYPFWLRFWHWLNALLFIVLIVSGISLHYSATSDLFLPFDVAISAHNIAGITLSIAYFFYLFSLFTSDASKSYSLKMKNLIPDLIKQAKYYISGIFNKEPHPFHTDATHRFNPLQKLTYIKVMFVFMPLVVITGLFLLLPDLAPDNIFGIGGIAPMAILHSISGFFLSLFMIGHIYLATTGTTWLSNFKAMITGWHTHEENSITSHKSEV